MSSAIFRPTKVERKNLLERISDLEIQLAEIKLNQDRMLENQDKHLLSIERKLDFFSKYLPYCIAIGTGISLTSNKEELDSLCKLLNEIKEQGKPIPPLDLDNL